MRLSTDEISAIKDCAARHFGAGATVRLFGSRVRDDLRGGDIDLHVIAETSERANLRTESAFREALIDRIGDQRIDVLLRSPDEPLEAIDQIAFATGCRLPLDVSPSPDDVEVYPRANVLRDWTGRVRLDWMRARNEAMDDDHVRTVEDSLAAGRAVRKRLLEALAFVEPRLPLSAETLDQMDRPERLEIDSLFLCFSNLVAVIQDQLIRSILMLEDEWSPDLSRLDQRNRVERLGALPEIVDYVAMINARNTLAHQYPYRADRQANTVNMIATAARAAIAAFDGLERYATGRLDKLAG